MGLGLEEQAVFYRQISLVFVSTIFVADLDAEALGHYPADWGSSAPPHLDGLDFE